MTEKENTGSVRITNKQIYEGLNDIIKTLALHNQRLELHIEHVDKKLGDHEKRIRKIEESVWRSSWVTSIITAVITAVVGAIILTTVGV
jgi:hypothetical protein